MISLIVILAATAIIALSITFNQSASASTADLSSNSQTSGSLSSPNTTSKCEL
jgi:hypothetical protein